MTERPTNERIEEIRAMHVDYNHHNSRGVDDLFAEIDALRAERDAAWAQIAEANRASMQGET